MTPTSGTYAFVGRERETAELTAALDDALEGRGGLVMLVGEPGIGKTRMTEEAEAIARSRGALSTRGTCYEGGSAPPYWPWTQAIRSLLIAPSEATLAALAPRATVIAEIVPEIRDIMPDLQPASEADPGQARFRLFDTVTSFLVEVSASQSLVVVLDDLHWADRSSLDLLEFIARDIATRQMLLIGGYRDMELSRRHPLSDTLAILARVHGFHRIPLRGLDSDEVSRLVKVVGDISPPPALIKEIHDRTEGNPFFVAEVTRDLAREAADRGGDFDAVGGFRISEGVREAIGLRLNRLSEECNQLLRSAAVIGRVFGFTLLAALNQENDDEALLDLIEEAIDAGVVEAVAGRGDRYQFTHALIQQTLAEELTTGRRVRLHSRIVDAMEVLYGDHLEEHYAELAHHCTEAETVVGEEKLIHYARMAGERAMLAYAWEEARSYFERALSAKTPGSKDREMADLWLKKGLAEAAAFLRPREAIVSCTEAFNIYMAIDDRPKAIQAVTMGMGAGIGEAPEQVKFYSLGLDLVKPGSLEAGMLLNEYASALERQTDDHDGAVAAASEAIEIAKHENDPLLHSMALMHLGRSLYDSRELEESFASHLAAIEILNGIDGVDSMTGWRVNVTLWNCHWGAARALRGLGRSAEGEHHLEESRKVTDRNPGARLWADLVYFNSTGTIATFEGRWDEATQLAQQFDEVAFPATSDLPLLRELMTGDPRSVINQNLPRLRFTSEESNWLWFSMGRAVILAEAGLILKHEATLSKCEQWANSVLQRPFPEVFKLNAAGILGLIAIARGDAKAAEEQYAVLEPYEGMLHDDLGPGSPDRILALLAKIMGRTGDAERHFESALDRARETGSRPWVAWIGHDYAELLVERAEASDSERAMAILVESLGITQDLGMVQLEESLTALKEKAESLSVPTGAYPDGLTEREVEVLRLLTAGRTNAQIADDLVITSNTAAKHVANILAKTDSANRTEAAAYANRQGLGQA
ncbi:MAG: AAA family ATPase [Chloroflexi bacterium]|nr:AAA family ATPase [Chloroflexota bacterium]